MSISMLLEKISVQQEFAVFQTDAKEKIILKHTAYQTLSTIKII